MKYFKNFVQGECNISSRGTNNSMTALLKRCSYSLYSGVYDTHVCMTLCQHHIPFCLPWQFRLPLVHTAGVWSTPQLKGERPLPCSSFSFTKVNHDKVILFGGYKKGYLSNDLYLFNLRNMVSWLFNHRGCSVQSGVSAINPIVRITPS